MSEHNPKSSSRASGVIDVESRLKTVASLAMKNGLDETYITVLDDAMREIKDLRKRIGDASIMLADWDGYYNPEKQKGDVVELAKLIEEAFTALQGRSWRSED